MSIWDLFFSPSISQGATRGLSLSLIPTHCLHRRYCISVLGIFDTHLTLKSRKTARGVKQGGGWSKCHVGNSIQIVSRVRAIVQIHSQRSYCPWYQIIYCHDSLKSTRRQQPVKWTSQSPRPKWLFSPDRVHLFQPTWFQYLFWHRQGRVDLAFGGKISRERQTDREKENSMFCLVKEAKGISRERELEWIRPKSTERTTAETTLCKWDDGEAALFHTSQQLPPPLSTYPLDAAGITHG